MNFTSLNYLFYLCLLNFIEDIKSLISVITQNKLRQGYVNTKRSGIGSRTDSHS